MKVTNTIVELDLVGYSTICDHLEQSLDVQTVKDLNDQIQSFIEAGLRAVKAQRDQTVMATTGDGAILAFVSAPDAHRFAEAVHAATRAHNETRTQPLAKRVFRSGAATGQIWKEPQPGGGFSIAGTTIARAVRLEAKAEPGSLLVDEATFQHLTGTEQKAYGPRKTVTGKRDEKFDAHPCQLNLTGPADAEFFTKQGKPETPSAIGRLLYEDTRRETLARFKRLKTPHYPDLIHLLAIPFGQQPSGELNLDGKRAKILQWAEEYERLDELLELLRELTETEGGSRPK